MFFVHRSRMRFAHAVALSLAGLMLSARLAQATEGPETDLAIIDFAYSDTSGEPVDQTAAHQKRLQAFMAALRKDLAGNGFRLVPVADAGEASPALLHAALNAGAKLAVVGGIHKLSTLVQWAKVQVVDVAENRILFDKLYTFRGDSDDAWNRAEIFVAREIRTALKAPVSDERRDER